MMKPLLLLLLAALAPAAAQPSDPAAEQQALSEALAEAGNSNHEFLAALEAHLAKFPNAHNRFELERAMVKAAIEIKDNARIIRYGEVVLSRDPEDLRTLDSVARALLIAKEPARALTLAVRYEKALRTLEPKPGAAPLRWQTRAELDQGLGRAALYQCRALTALGKSAEAIEAGRRALQSHATADAAGSLAEAYLAANRPEAIDAFAEAYILAPEAERIVHLEKLREAWRKSHPSDAGLGDHILTAQDWAIERGKERLARLRALDPNALRLLPGDYVLSAPKGPALEMSTLRGKVIVLDFWATWCGPCRTQHPLYEEVKKRFAGREDVVFLNLATDEEKELVQPFLEKTQWQGRFYFEDGLSRLLSVTSIPTTIILNKRGQVASQMNGFIPDRFVDSLTARVRRILEE